MTESRLKSIVVIIPYFGEWPEWIDVFLLSCSKNPSISWRIYTDCRVPDIVPSNVIIRSCTFREYCELVSDRVQIMFRPLSTYRLCDVRPMFGLIHADEIEGFDYYGYGDIDVVYGDIRAKYTDNILVCDYISSHGDIASGHLSLFRNTSLMHEAFKKIPNWREKIETPGSIQWKDNLNEAGLTRLLHPRYIDSGDGLDNYRVNNCFVERYSTPFKPEPWIGGSAKHPDVWIWNEGKLSNTIDCGLDFLYLHFMNFRYGRYVNDDFGRAPWEGLDKLVHFDASDYRAKIIRIDRAGFHLES